MNPIMHPIKKNIVSSLLSYLYEMVVAFRNYLYSNIAAFSIHSGRPTVSIGGIHAGGTGKTPMALLVGLYLQSKGREIVFLSRGYGRKTKKNVIRGPGETESWETVGDEPALLHAALPKSWLGIGADRSNSVRALSPALSPKAIYILDDGFQHRRLRRDIDIVCLPPASTKDVLLPIGTLREPLSGLSRAHLICLIGDDGDSALLESSRRDLTLNLPNVPVIVLHQTPLEWIHLVSHERQQRLPLQHPIAVCGIARPERFLFLIKKMGISISAESIFNDHHEFRFSEIESLFKKARTKGIITTEKDAFRLGTLKVANQPDIWYLRIVLQFSEAKDEKIFKQICDTLIV